MGLIGRGFLGGKSVVAQRCRRDTEERAGAWNRSVIGGVKGVLEYMFHAKCVGRVYGRSRRTQSQMVKSSSGKRRV